jgi:hypothetical protein
MERHGHGLVVADLDRSSAGRPERVRVSYSGVVTDGKGL